MLPRHAVRPQAAGIPRISDAVMPSGVADSWQWLSVVEVRIVLIRVGVLVVGLFSRAF